MTTLISRPAAPLVGRRPRVKHLFGTTALAFVTFMFSPMLAYQWQTPLGNITPTRIGILGLFCALSTTLIKTRVGRRGATWLFAQGFLLLLLIVGTAYSVQVTLAITAILNHIEAACLFVLFYILVKGRRWLTRRGAAMLPLYAYLPSGAMALYQAAQLSLGQIPSIPLLSLTSLASGSANAATTAFGTGLDAFGLDRIAAATGDPPTFGILSALVLVYLFWVRSVVDSLPRLRVMLVVAVACAGVVLSQSLSALIVLGIGIGAQLARQRFGEGYSHPQAGRRGGHGTWALFAGVGLVMAITLVLVPTAPRFVSAALTRIVAFGQGTGTLGNHLALLGGGLTLFGTSPLLGVGTGAASSLYFGQPVDFSSFHDVLILRMAENGVLGGVAVLLTWLVLARYVPFSIMVASLAAWFLYMDWNRLPYIWCLLGVVAALHEAHRDSQMTRSGSDTEAGSVPATRPNSQLSPPVSRVPGSW
jgi:hypothetical protein